MKTKTLKKKTEEDTRRWEEFHAYDLLCKNRYFSKTSLNIHQNPSTIFTEIEKTIFIVIKTQNTIHT